MGGDRIRFNGDDPGRRDDPVAIGPDRVGRFLAGLLLGGLGWISHPFGPFQHLSGHSDSDPFSQLGVIQPSLFVVDSMFDFGQRVGIIHDRYAGIDFVKRGPIPDALNQHPRDLLHKYWLDRDDVSSSQDSGIMGANQRPWCIQIGYSIICLLIAVAGGWYGRWVGRLRPVVINPDRSGDT